MIRCSIFVLICLQVNIALIRGGQAGMGALSTALFAIRGKREGKPCRLEHFPLSMKRSRRFESSLRIHWV